MNASPPQREFWSRDRRDSRNWCCRHRIFISLARRWKSRIAIHFLSENEPTLFFLSFPPFSSTEKNILLTANKIGWKIDWKERNREFRITSFHPPCSRTSNHIRSSAVNQVTRGRQRFDWAASRLMRVTRLNNDHRATVHGLTWIHAQFNTRVRKNDVESFEGRAWARVDHSLFDSLFLFSSFFFYPFLIFCHDR